MPQAGHYVAELVRDEDYDRFLTAVLAPKAARDSLLALYAFNVEVARVRESVSESLIGQMKLQWWRDVVAAVFEGKPTPKGNPVVDAIAATITAHNLSRSHFEALLDARAQDMTDETPPDLEALEIYADGTSASLTLLALEVLGARDDASKQAGRHVGIAWALTGMLRAVLFHARANRFLLPQDLMAAASLTSHDLHERRNATKISTVVAQIAERAGEHIAKARALRGQVDRKGLAALLPATLADGYLKGLARRKFDVFDPRHALQRPAALRLSWNAMLGLY